MANSFVARSLHSLTHSFKLVYDTSNAKYDHARRDTKIPPLTTLSTATTMATTHQRRRLQLVTTMSVPKGNYNFKHTSCVGRSYTRLAIKSASVMKGADPSRNTCVTAAETTTIMLWRWLICHPPVLGWRQTHEMLLTSLLSGMPNEKEIEREGVDGGGGLFHERSYLCPKYYNDQLVQTVD